MIEIWVFDAASESMTHELASAIAQCAASGTVIGLRGTLGAGKTSFVRGLAAALGVPDDWVVSPTFVLCQTYEGRIPIFHFDAYRLSTVDEFLSLGTTEIIGQIGLAVVEWSDRVSSALPEDRLDVLLEDTGQTARRITLTALGPMSLSVLKCARSRLISAN